MSIAARSRAEKLFNIQNVIDQHLDIYSSPLNNFN